MASIAHYIGGKFSGTITPDNDFWRKSSLNFEARQASHYERKPRKVSFVIVPTGTTPAENLPKATN